MVEVQKEALKSGVVKTIYTVTSWDGDRPYAIHLLAEVSGERGGKHKVEMRCRALKIAADFVGDEERDLMVFGAQFVGRNIEFWPASRPPWIGDYLGGVDEVKS